MSLAVLELIQKDSGEIVLQAEGSEEPLLRLEFSRQLTDLLGADALTLAQAMVESASYAFEYAADLQGRGDGLAGLEDGDAGASGSRPPLAAGLDTVDTANDGSEPGDDDPVRLQTSPLH